MTARRRTATVHSHQARDSLPLKRTPKNVKGCPKNLYGWVLQATRHRQRCESRTRQSTAEFERQRTRRQSECAICCTLAMRIYASIAIHVSKSLPGPALHRLVRTYDPISHLVDDQFAEPQAA